MGFAFLPKDLVKLIGEYIDVSDYSDFFTLRLLNKHWLESLCELKPIDRLYREIVAARLRFHIRADTNLIQTGYGLLAWGSNQYGELGNGVTTNIYQPAKAWTKSNLNDLNKLFQSIAFNYFVLGANFTLAVDQYHDIWISGQDTENISKYISKGYDIRQSPATFPTRILSQSILRNHLIQPVTHIVPLMADLLVVVSGNTIFTSLSEFYKSIASNAKEAQQIKFTPANFNEVIVDTKPGAEHVLFLTNYGNVYGWGINNYGQLGLGYCEEQPYADELRQVLPQQNVFLSQIKQVAATEDSSYFLTYEGKLYGCGHNGHGELGIDSDLAYQPALASIELIAESTITAVVTGSHHVLCLTKTGDVYGWGDNRHSQLGIASAYSSISVPTQIWSSTQAKPIVKIAAGANHTLLLTKNCELWVCGDNREGQLGLGEDSAPFYTQFVNNKAFDQLALPKLFSTSFEQHNKDSKSIKPRSPLGVSPIAKKQRKNQAGQYLADQSSDNIASSSRMLFHEDDNNEQNEWCMNQNRHQPKN